MEAVNAPDVPRGRVGEHDVTWHDRRQRDSKRALQRIVPYTSPELMSERRKTVIAAAVLGGSRWGVRGAVVSREAGRGARREEPGHARTYARFQCAAALLRAARSENRSIPERIATEAAANARTDTSSSRRAWGNGKVSPFGMTSAVSEPP